MLFNLSCDLHAEHRIRRFPYKHRRIKSEESIFAALPLSNCQAKFVIQKPSSSVFQVSSHLYLPTPMSFFRCFRFKAMNCFRFKGMNCHLKTPR